MVIVAGLGNPGLQYEESRHNMGYWAADALAKIWKVSFSSERYKAYFASARVAGDAAAILKPTTYMNNSGLCVVEAAKQLKLDNREIIVIYDDMDLPVGKIRVRMKGGPGTHNGMKSIVNELGSEDFNRIRVGIGMPAENEDIIDFVLGKPVGETYDLLRAAAVRAAEAADAIVRFGIETAMQRYNR